MDEDYEEKIRQKFKDAGYDWDKAKNVFADEMDKLTDTNIEELIKQRKQMESKDK